MSLSLVKIASTFVCMHVCVCVHACMCPRIYIVPFQKPTKTHPNEKSNKVQLKYSENASKAVSGMLGIFIGKFLHKDRTA